MLVLRWTENGFAIGGWLWRCRTVKNAKKDSVHVLVPVPDRGEGGTGLDLDPVLVVGAAEVEVDLETDEVDAIVVTRDRGLEIEGDRLAALDDGKEVILEVGPGRPVTGLGVGVEVGVILEVGVDPGAEGKRR